MVLATRLRPAATPYAPLRDRLRRLRERATHPRQDVIELRTRVANPEAARAVADDERGRLVGASERQRVEAEAELRRVEADARRRVRELDDELDRVLGDVEQRVGRTTDDRELVAGLRAIVELARGARGPVGRNERPVSALTGAGRHRRSRARFFTENWPVRRLLNTGR